MLNISEVFVAKEILDTGEFPEFTNAYNAINGYRVEKHAYDSKQKRVDAWDETEPDVMSIVVSVFTLVLLNEPIIYQSMIGQLNHLIKLDNPTDRFKIIADLIGIISNAGLINVNRPGYGQYINITSDFEVGDIPEKEKHIILTHRPQPVENNWDPEHHSMLLGHPMNHHDKEICLSHLDRLNQIPLKLNEAFVQQYHEAPKNEPKTAEAQQQWLYFMGESAAKYKELMAHGKDFYEWHKYDSRGRTYTCGYHVTTQGNGFKKAMIELAEEELVNGNY